MKIVQILPILLSLIFYGCKSNKCSPKTKRQISLLGNGLQVERGKEIIISKDSGKAIIKGIDECNKAILYKAQVKFITKDSSIRNGFFKVFYPNGRLRMFTFYKKGIQDSTHLVYWPNGNIKFSGFKLRGQFYGLQKMFYKNGNLKIESFLTNDTSGQFLIKYDDNGNISKLGGRVISGMLKLRAEKGFIGCFNRVVKVEKTNTLLHIQLQRANRTIVDTTIKKFNNINNWPSYIFVKHLKIYGHYKYTAIALLQDKEKKPLKVDTFIKRFVYK